jgi:quercetin dioxygenase-like cupin family protein
MKPVRRIVCADGPDGKSKAVDDGPAPVRTDPARPGFSSAFIWATDATPARIGGDPPRVLAPPPGGSLCRILTFPPERGPHRGIQRTRTLDFCLILEGEITLVLDTEEVELRAGDTAVQRGTRHAWSNRSDAPCVIAISSHDATD